MSREREIHKIDNWLIRLGWVLLAFGALGIFGAATTNEYRLQYPGGRAETISSSEDASTVRRMHPDADVTTVQSAGMDAAALWMAGAGALMLVAGHYVRRREKRALAVWGILEQAIDVRADDVAASTGLTREQLRETLATINAQPGAFYVWDAGSDRIVDGRLRKRVVQVDRCASCGAGVSVALTLDLAASPACNWCGGPVATGAEITRLRSETLSEIRSAAGPAKPFSIAIFLVLLLVFWPAAIAYALWKGGVLEGLRERLGLGAPPPRA